MEALTPEQELSTISLEVKGTSDLEKKDWIGACFIASVEIEDSDLYSSAEAVSILKFFGSPIAHSYTEG